MSYYPELTLSEAKGYTLLSMKRIALLGSTGSIGRQTLEVVSHLGSGFTVVALAAHSNIDLLEAQALKYSPKLIAVYDQEKADILKKRLPKIAVVSAMEGLKEVASCAEADFVVSALAGTVGIEPTIAALRAGKQVGLANKEVLVSAGRLVMDLAESRGLPIIPIDSEHSALFQCLQGGKNHEVRRLILTASGGPFLRTPKEALEMVDMKSASNHPTWNMGPKVTVDSSTLMNKGLEVIEAHFLFGIPVERIEVVIHPQSVIHSMVEWVDGSILAQMSAPDMRVPIQYALTFPERRNGLLTPHDFRKFAHLDFEAPDYERFPCLSLAFAALEAGGTAPCFLNAANEALVGLFLKEKIRWVDIGRYLEKFFKERKHTDLLSLSKILETDTLARALVHNILG